MTEKDGKEYEMEKERFLLEEAEKISEITSYMMQLPPHKSKQKEYFKFLLGRYAALRPENERFKEAVSNIDYKIVIQGLNAALNEAKFEIKSFKTINVLKDKEYDQAQEEITALKAEIERLKVYSKFPFGCDNAEHFADEITRLKSELSTMRGEVERLNCKTAAKMLESEVLNDFNDQINTLREALEKIKRHCIHHAAGHQNIVAVYCLEIANQALSHKDSGGNA